MKSLKLLFSSMIAAILFSSCVIVGDNYVEETGISLEQVISNYDLWYVDYHRKIGNGDVPYVSKAFTISFLNGILYANNNIADIGSTGNGLGIDVGTYYTNGTLLQTNHDLDGGIDFEVTQISANEIRLYNYRENVTYFLIGYQTSEFDYDALFYENIEYFLQEYVAWEKVDRSINGAANGFDNETFLQFTSENNTTFYSSIDDFGTKIDIINWDFVGGYEVFDITGYKDLKALTLIYDGGDTEEFELSVINDQTIRLYHIESKTTYDFSGRGFVLYLKGGISKKEAKYMVRNNGRKRTKVIRKTKTRKNLK